MAINLDSLSPTELQALIKSAEAQMDSARKNHVREVRAKIDGVLASAGLALSDVYPTRGGKGAKGPKAAVAPKYRNPGNPAQTWSGRGKRPLWFNEALKKKGVTADSLLIAGASPKAAPAKKAAAKATRKASTKKAAKK
ncbi:H-NS histone family protein [Rhodanobacter sp. DHG33]|uniref:H-NS histone family protein n=1 Tax=Rhodanobacter sp. DHG33 TaxID=2775921 RepID=UPI00178419FE|nr:H-NS histone family protein [Rhodanobacter sp. DHG33]MBD8900600.1 H-NS histone family protein [Rhodanobacter sp. DHG33]